MKKEEIFRKLLHLIALAIPFSIYYLPHNISLYGLISTSTVFLLIEILRLNIKSFNYLFHKSFGIFLRPKEKNRFTGATYMLISSLICTLLFTKEIAFISLSFIIVGDAAAALIGINFGKIKIFGKTLEGTIGCFAASMIFWLLFPVLTFYKGITAAIITAIIELLPIKIDDNLIVPIITGLIITML